MQFTVTIDLNSDVLVGAVQQLTPLDRITLLERMLATFEPTEAQTVGQYIDECVTTRDARQRENTQQVCELAERFARSKE